MSAVRVCCLHGLWGYIEANRLFMTTILLLVQFTCHRHAQIILRGKMDRDTCVSACTDSDQYYIRTTCRHDEHRTRRMELNFFMDGRVLVVCVPYVLMWSNLNIKLSTALHVHEQTGETRHFECSQDTGVRMCVVCIQISRTINRFHCKVDGYGCRWHWIPSSNHVFRNTFYVKIESNFL